MTPTGPCSLPPDALDERLASWRALEGSLVDSYRTGGGLVLRYRLEPVVVDRLLELIEAERHCCPSIVFDATVLVHVEAPGTWADQVVSALVADPGEPPRDAGEGAGVDGEALCQAVRAHYAVAAQAPGAGEERPMAGIGAGVYGSGVRGALPDHVVAASIGCADPVALAELAAGETVLDLGSGGGLDVLLSARRVGPTGKAYGLDMTEEMLELARRNQADAGVANAEFLRGHIEAIPLPDQSVDVVLSNCVFALSPEKRAVFAEAYRVLRPGGRLAVADVVGEAPARPSDPADTEAWVSCLAGCLTRSQYRDGLAAAGFAGVSIEESHLVADGFASVVVRALRPPN